MDAKRIAELRAELEAERIDLVEGGEIEAAFAEIPDSALSDVRENAMWGDMLDEIEAYRPPGMGAVDDLCRYLFEPTGH